MNNFVCFVTFLNAFLENDRIFSCKNQTLFKDGERLADILSEERRSEEELGLWEVAAVLDGDSVVRNVDEVEDGFLWLVEQIE